MPKSPFLVHGSVVSAKYQGEVAYQSRIDKAKSRVVLASSEGNGESDVDISWLPWASETYHVSSDIKDYILVPIPAVTVPIPNRNLQAFPLEEVTFFDHLAGRCVFQTFIGKMTCLEHDNLDRYKNVDPNKAQGVIFDATLVHIPKWDVWKIIVMGGFDTAKNPDLCSAILSSERNSYSMGALVKYFACSCCGHKFDGRVQCNCMRSPGKGGVINGRLVYQRCLGDNFIEISSVSDPADDQAVSNEVLWGSMQ